MATKKYLDYAGLKRVLAKLLPGARKIWHGTLAEWEALSATEKAKYDQAEVIDEYTGVPVVVDKVESGNMNAVTSNAVAKVISLNNAKFTPKVAVLISDVHCDIKAGICIFYLFFTVANDTATGTTLYDVPKNIGQAAQAIFITAAGTQGAPAKRLRIEHNGKQLRTIEPISAGTLLCGQLVYFTDEEDV